MPLSEARKVVSSLLVLGGGAASCFTLLALSGDEKAYSKIIMPMLRKLDPEVSHKVSVKMTSLDLVPRLSYIGNSDALKTRVFGIDFENPVGLAAGYDKDGKTLPSIFHLGFGFVEIGSVTPLAQPGNEKPRIFRLLKDEAIINRYGFNSEGANAVAERMKHYRTTMDDFPFPDTNMLNINFYSPNVSFTFQQADVE